MRPPPFEAFDSSEIGPHGRRYTVWKRVRLVAFWLDHGGALPCPDPVYIFTFIEGRRVGYWQWTTEAADLERIMTVYRNVNDPKHEREVGDAHIRPQWNRETERELRDVDAGQGDFLDVGAMLEGGEAPERQPRRVIRLFEEEGDGD